MLLSFLGKEEMLGAEEDKGDSLNQNSVKICGNLWLIRKGEGERPQSPSGESVSPLPLIAVNHCLGFYNLRVMSTLAWFVN